MLISFSFSKTHCIFNNIKKSILNISVIDDKRWCFQPAYVDIIANIAFPNKKRAAVVT